MIRLRPYKSCDAAVIEKWIRDRDVFVKWGGERFGKFPVDADTIDEKYRLKNGDCEEPDNFYPWTAIDDGNRAVGHFIMRYLNGDRKRLRFGWVIVDDSVRGKGCGTQMLRAGLKYAFEILGADSVTIGVFEHNDAARNCYRKVGFKELEIVKAEPENIVEMEIKRGAVPGESGPPAGRADRGVLWGKAGDGNICIGTGEILYLESVDDKVFAYTKDKVLKIEGTLNSFMLETADETFFRCSKSMVINVNRVISLKSLSSNRIDTTLEGGEHIIISRRYAAEFRRLLKGDR